MGRLSGFKYRDVVRRPRTFGYVFDRQAAGSHEIWRHTGTRRKVTIPHHAKDMAEGTLRTSCDRLTSTLTPFCGLETRSYETKITQVSRRYVGSLHRTRTTISAQGDPAWET